MSSFFKINPFAFLFSTFQWLSSLLKVILGRCPKSFSGQSRVLRPTGGTTPPPCWDTQNNVGWVLWHLWTVAKQILFWSWANISHISMFLLKTRLSQYKCKHNSPLGIYEGYYNHPDYPASNFCHRLTWRVFLLVSHCIFEKLYFVFVLSAAGRLSCQSLVCRPLESDQMQTDPNQV